MNHLTTDEDGEYLPLPGPAMGLSLAPALEAVFDHSHTSSWDVDSPAVVEPFFDGSYDSRYHGPDGTIHERRRNLNGERSLTTMTSLDPALFDSSAWSPGVSSGMTEMCKSTGYFSVPMDQNEVRCTGSASVSPPATSTVWSAGIPGMNMAYLAGPSGGLPADICAPSFNDHGHYYGDMELFDTSYYQVPKGEGLYGSGSVVLKSHENEMSNSGQLARGGNSVKSSSSGKRKSSVVSKEERPLLPKKERKRKADHDQDAQPTLPSGIKLRTASRQRPSEVGQGQKPGESPQHQLARTTHNKVEKAYRNRLNREFELLVAVLPPSEAGRLSKADAIDGTEACIGSLADRLVELREKKRQKDERKMGKKGKDHQ